MSKAKIRVLVIDDSALMRAILSDLINSDPRMEVIGVASDPFEAREQIKKLNPDVLTLDIEMPKMNGIAFLKNLMRLRPMPVVMISTLTQAGAPSTLEALECGAVDFIGKPKGQNDEAIKEYSHQVVEKVYWASKANVKGNELGGAAEALQSVARSNKILKPGFLCAIGASTGGTEAIKAIVSTLPEDSPPIVIAQHIPEAFSTSFARRLNQCSAMTVYEAEHNQVIASGCVYLAPGHSHLQIARQAQQYICRLDQQPPVNRHRPSVEVLFDSVIAAAGNRAMGVLLTGMGADGSEALLRMLQAGCDTVAQDESSSVVWGMPGVAVKLGAASKILPLNRIASCILKTAFKA